MSIRLIQKVWEAAIATPTDRFVAVVIADHCGDDGKGWVGLGRIEEYTHLHRRTIQRALEDLQKGGFLVVRTNAGGYRTNHYELQFPEGGTPPPWRRTTVAHDRPGGRRTTTLGVAQDHPKGGVRPPNPSVPVQNPSDHPLAGGARPAGGEPLARPSQVGEGGEKKRRRDLPFEALVEIDGARLGEMSDVEKGRIGRALLTIRQVWPTNTPRPPEPAKGVAGPEREKWEKELEAYRAAREIDDPVLANEIKRRAQRWGSEVFPNAKCTSSALAAHWSKCAPPGGTVPAGHVANSGGRYPLPIGCDFHAVGREVGLRIGFDVPWSEVSFESRAKILEAYHAKELVT